MDGFCVLAESILQTRIGLTTRRLNVVVLNVQRAWAPTPQGPSASFSWLQKCSGSNAAGGNCVSKDRSAASAHRMKAPARGIRGIDTGCSNSSPQHRVRSSKPRGSTSTTPSASWRVWRSLAEFSVNAAHHIPIPYLNLTALTFKSSRPRSERAGSAKIHAGKALPDEYNSLPKNRERRKTKKENTVTSIS